jgi:hypothetical protein
MLERLEAADESMTIKSIFIDISAGIVERLTHSLCADVEPVGEEVIKRRVALIFDELQTSELSTKVLSLLAEKAFYSIIERALKPEAIEIAYGIGEGALNLLGKTTPDIRRLR